MLNDLKNLFKGNNFLLKIIVVNAIIFFVFAILGQLFNEVDLFVRNWLALPASLESFLFRPWTIITYQFIHHSFRHLFFNMLMLFWFARIFSDYMGTKRLAGLYFIGGIAGGLLYMIVYSLMFLSGEFNLEFLQMLRLVGASASIMAVLIATGRKFGEQEISLLFIGAVPLKYVALVIFLTSTFLDFVSNFGGSMAHIGGAFIGWIYISQLNRGKDIALTFSALLDRLAKLLEKKPKLRVVKNEHYSKVDLKEKTSEKERQAKTDAILDKISKSGYDNLTSEEKEFLFNLSKNK